MSSTTAVNILIGIAVVGLLLVRQMQPGAPERRPPHAWS